MSNVQRYGVIPDMVYGHDKFGPVTSHTEPGYFVAEHEFERVTAERDALQALLTAADEELDRAGGAYLNKNAECLRLRERADVMEGLLSSGSALGDCHLERLRQIDVENRSPVDDDDYSLGQLAYAAAGYAQGSVPAQQVQGCLRPSYWPWHPRWWKPGSPRRMLVKAAALILAEIERIDRAALKPAEGGGDDTTIQEDREDAKKAFVRTNTKQGQNVSLADMQARYETKP